MNNGERIERSEQEPAAIVDSLLDQSVDRRTALKLTGLFAVLLNSACKGKSKKEPTEATREKRREVSPESIERSDKVIGAYEKGYEEFGKLVNEKVNSISNPYFKWLIAETFKLVAKNSKSSDKNYLRFVQKNPEVRKNRRFLDKDHDKFYYYVNFSRFVNVPGGRSNAAFGAPVRIMQISSHYDSQNLLNQITFMHELIHVIQDDEVRKEKATKKEYYDQELSFDKERFVDREAIARAAEIELANALLDGYLQETLSKENFGKKRVDYPMLMRKLKIPRTDFGRLKALVMRAVIYYYNGGAVDNKLPPLFVKYVRKRLI